MQVLTKEIVNAAEKRSIPRRMTRNACQGHGAIVPTCESIIMQGLIFAAVLHYTAANTQFINITHICQMKFSLNNIYFSISGSHQRRMPRFKSASKAPSFVFTFSKISRSPK